MIRFIRPCGLVFVAPLVLLPGCAAQYPAQDLGDRLQSELAPQLSNGSAMLERLPDGARVTFPDQTLFPTGSAELDAKGQFVLASLVEALLAPALLQVDIAGPAATPAPVQQARAVAVTQFLHGIQVAPNLLFTSLREAAPADGTAPQATMITVTLPEHSSRTDHPT
jgi:outer membrane protein OmpA-like peptidoglycan-associated protein